MIKTRYQAPYTEKGKAVFTGKKPGVYLIKRGNTLLYVGFSGENVYKTLYRHFQSWYDPKQVRVSYKNNMDGIKARVIYCNKNNAAALERALILKHKPKDNPDKLEKYEMTQREGNMLNRYHKTPPSYEDAPF